MIINCIAVDDEPPALNIVTENISRVPYLNLVKTFNNGIDAVNFLESNNNIDLIFLDIEMGEISGIKLINVLSTKPKIILTTAYENYAIEAFNLDVIDYLLKPYSFERFLKAVNKVYSLIRKEQLPNEMISTENDFIFVKSDYKKQKVNIDDILFIEGLNDYLIIKTKTIKIITHQSFKNIEILLPPMKFIRIHKSFLIAVNKIDSVEGKSVKISGTEIPIGDKYRKSFFDFISRFSK